MRRNLFADVTFFFLSYAINGNIAKLSFYYHAGRVA